MKMAEWKNANQVVRELKQLDGKDPDPHSLNVRELRGRNDNEELHPPSIRQPPPGLIHVHSTVQNFRKETYLPPTANRSKYSSVG